MMASARRRTRTGRFQLRLHLLSTELLRLRLSRSCLRLTPPPAEAIYCPQLLASSAPSRILANVFIPLQIWVIPGWPSFFLARNPPSCAIQVTDCFRDGGLWLAVGSLVNFAARSFHSTSSRKIRHGVSGATRATNVIQRILQATILITARYRVSLWAVDRRHSSTCRPDLSTLCQVAVLHRRQYHATFSRACSRSWTGVLVSSIQSIGSQFGGGSISET